MMGGGSSSPHGPARTPPRDGYTLNASVGVRGMRGDSGITGCSNKWVNGWLVTLAQY